MLVAPVVGRVQLQSLVQLEVERFVDLNLQPVPPYELYQRRIRASSTNTSKAWAHMVDALPFQSACRASPLVAAS